LRYDEASIAPNRARREAVLALWQAYADTGEAIEAVTLHLKRSKYDALHEDNDRAYRSGARSHDAYHRRRREIYDSMDAEHSLVEAQERSMAAELAYESCGDKVMTTPDELPLRCQLSGVVLLEADDVLEDSRTNECVLKSLVLGPKRAMAEVV
jgi:hypothetical protein